MAKISGSNRKVVGQEILEITDISSMTFKRPVDRGYVVNWELQKEVWSHGLKKLLLKDMKSTGEVAGIVVSEPYMNLSSMQESLRRVLKEDMKFTSVLVMCPATMAMFYLALSTPPAQQSLSMQAGAGVVIDVGFSYTHIVPIFDWRPIKGAIRRIDLGGKALTNYMKELVSYRSMNMMKETHLVEHIREELSFISEDLDKDLKASKGKKSPFRVEWFLPDGVTSKWGHIRDPSEPRGPKDPILVINNERFMVPELLFNPSDIGLEEAGVAEACVQAVGQTHPNIHGLLYSNISIIGGIAKCPGMKNRLYSELRPLVPDDYDVHITIPDDPDIVAWKGASIIGASPKMFQSLLNDI